MLQPTSSRGARRRLITALVITGLALSWITVRSLSDGRASPRASSPSPSAPTRLSPPVSPRPSATPKPAPTPTPAAVPVPAASDTFSATTSLLLASQVQSQLPELRNGCEATSLSMLLQAVGRPVSKLTLAREQPTDATQPVFSSAGPGFDNIVSWGNPNRTFVGRVARSYGYGIYHGPLSGLLERQLPGRALDLSGKRFSDILGQLRTGVPVMLWTTTTLQPTSQWVTWDTPDGPFRATPYEHAVLLVGYTPRGLIVNDPLAGQQRLVSAAPFIASWQQLGRQAVSVQPAES